MPSIIPDIPEYVKIFSVACATNHGKVAALAVVQKAGTGESREGAWGYFQFGGSKEQPSFCLHSIPPPQHAHLKEKISSSKTKDATTPIGGSQQPSFAVNNRCYLQFSPNKPNKNFLWVP